MIRLKVSDGTNAWEYPLGDIDKVVIGRAPTADIQITEQRSSRMHCQIEMIPGGHKLVDLESRNGTRVNGQTVNTRILEPGDEIQIGQTTVRYGEKVVATVTPPAAAPPAATPPAAQKAQAPAYAGGKTDDKPELSLDDDDAGSAPMGTIRLEKRPSHRMPVQREARVPWELVFVGVGILAVLFIGTMVYNSMAASDERAKMLKGAVAKLEEAQTQITFTDKMAKMKEAIDKYERLISLHGGSDEARKAKKTLDEIVPEFKSLEKWYKKYQIVIVGRANAGDSPTLDQLLDWDDDLAKIEADCPHGVIGAEARVERSDIARSVESAGQRLLEQHRSELAVTLAAEDFTRVLTRWELFRDRYKRFPFMVKAVDSEVAAVKDKAMASYAKIEKEVDRLMDAGRIGEAKVLLDRARERFLGTDAHAKAVVKMQVVSLMKKGGQNREQAEETVSARKEIYLSAADAEAAARKREYAKSVRLYKDIVMSTSIPEVKEEFGRRIEQMERIQGLINRFITEATDGDVKGQDWGLGPGTVVSVAGADQDWVIFKLTTGQGETRKRWREFSDTQLAELLNLCATDTDSRFDLATFCFRHNLDERAEEILAGVYADSPSAMDRINVMLSEQRGEAVPDGGYVVFRNKWMTRAQKVRAEEDARIADLVEIVLKKPVAEAAGAVGRLSAMKRGRPELVKALHQKRKTLKKKLTQGLRFDNQTLVALKRQLDEARAEALDFIEDETRYPDKKKMEAQGKLAEYIKIQKEQVDPRVDAVRQIWENPYAAAVKLNPKAKSYGADLKKVNEWLAREDKEFNPEEADENDQEYLASLANNQLNIQTFATDKKEQKLVAFNLAVMEWNDTNKTATAEERAQVAILNRYRMMLGRRCLKIEDMLVRAARGHSEYLNNTGKFAHVIPGHPNGATPKERCAKEGYTGGATGENISRGHTDPQGTHIAWYNSSGHHRNMIKRDWTVMGAGFAGRDWTQNFGSADTTKGSPSGGGWPGTAFRGGRSKRK